MVLWESISKIITNMKKLSQLFKSETKDVPVREFPSYIRERALNKDSSIYCIIEMSKDRELYPYLKYGDWEYYWFSYNWKLLDSHKESKEFESLPCLLVLDPRKLSVRSFLEQRMEKGIYLIVESSSPREKVIESCPNFLQVGTGDNVDNFEPMAKDNLRILLNDSPYKQKRSLFKYFDAIWLEKANETVLEFCKTQDEEFVQEQVGNQNQVKKEVSLLGAMMDSISDQGTKHKVGDTFSTQGWVLG